MRGNKGEQMRSVEEVFKNKNITFEDIHKLHYDQFNRGSKNESGFKPSDILDMDDRDSDDEILKKFKKG